MGIRPRVWNMVVEMTSLERSVWVLEQFNTINSIKVDFAYHLTSSMYVCGLCREPGGGGIRITKLPRLDDLHKLPHDNPITQILTCKYWVLSLSITVGRL